MEWNLINQNLHCTKSRIIHQMQRFEAVDLGEEDECDILLEDEDDEDLDGGGGGGGPDGWQMREGVRNT